jgi:Putative Ser protein kinase
MLDNADVPNVHVEPHTLEMAGLFGVLTRLEEPTDETVSLLEKAKVYNGELEDEEIDRRKLREDAAESADIGEGMEGVSARFIGDEIAEAIMDATHRDRSHLSPLSVFDHFEANLGGHGSIAADDLAATSGSSIRFARSTATAPSRTFATRWRTTSTSSVGRARSTWTT